MYKKLIGIILSVILCSSVFAGCALVEHNDAKDARQIVASIDPIVEKDDDGNEVYRSEKKVIYKSELISTMNSYAETYMSNYGLTLQQATERLLDEMISRELLLIEADRIEKQGLIEWTQKDENDLLRSVYSAIDNQIASFRNEILSEYDESGSSSSGEETSDTTYPTKPEETTDDDFTDYARDEHGNIMYETNEDGSFVLDEDGEKVPKIAVWAPERKDYPCLWGNDEQKSLDREAVQRFVALLQSAAENDFRTTKEDKAKFAQDDKKIEDTVNAKGWEGVYPMLGETHYVQYLLGESAKQSILIDKLQEYITDDVDVTDQEVADSYNTLLAYQVTTYNTDASAYQTAVSDGSTTVLYYLDNSYFFVKHILLPFSDEQTAQLSAYKADPTKTAKDFAEYRARMANDIVVYPHVNGENDTDNPTTVARVFEEIRAKMNGLRSDAKAAERKFDEYIYMYNTDPGAFGYGKQYAVKRGDDEGHSGYMEEFYDGAMQLATNYREGELLQNYVVTDYGVHIMYFSQDIVGNTTRGLDAPLTPGAYGTVRETLKETIRTAKENNAFTMWQNERITYYQESANVVRTYPKRYKSLYKS